MKFVTILIFTVLQYSHEQSVMPRIINGNETTIEQHPWMVSLQFLGKHFCGGSIIRNDTVVTAAHCVTELLVKSYRVVAGVTNLNDSSSSTKHRIDSFVIHSRYDVEIRRDYDIAVLKLSSQLEFSDKVQPIALPPKGENIPEGTPVKASGWGVTQTHSDIPSKVLREVELTIVNNEICQKKVKKPVTKRMICATGGKAGKDTCQLDSGGALEQNGTLAGIISWGRGCGIKNMPGVYTNVAELRSWIDENT